MVDNVQRAHRIYNIHNHHSQNTLDHYIYLAMSLKSVSDDHHNHVLESYISYLEQNDASSSNTFHPQLNFLVL